MTFRQQTDKLLRGLVARGRGFGLAESGLVAIIFAFALLPVTMMLGVAIDYSRATSAANRLHAAADSGALAAAQAATQALAAGNANWSAAGVAAGKNAFTANALGLTTATPTIVLTQSGTGATAQLTVSGQISTGIMGLAGVPTLNFQRSSTATTGAAQGSGPTYANISLVLDVSPSMSVAATATDVTNMKAATLAQNGQACAYACHDLDNMSQSNYSIARANNVTLRIDVVKSAAQALTNYISNAATSAGQYTMGLYTMSWGLKTLVAPTSNLASVSTAIGDVDFDQMSVMFSQLPAPAAANVASGDGLQPYADTDFGASLATLNTIVPMSGTGTSSASPKQVVLLVTDGLYDTGVPYNGGVSVTYNYPSVPNFSSGNDQGKYTRPFDPSLCDTLKGNGVKVGVLYVTYVADPTDPTNYYQEEVETNAPPAALLSQLQACASSPGLFYQATDLAGIQTGLTTMFNNAVGTGSLRIIN